MFKQPWSLHFSSKTFCLFVCLDIFWYFCSPNVNLVSGLFCLFWNTIRFSRRNLIFFLFYLMLITPIEIRTHFTIFSLYLIQLQLSEGNAEKWFILFCFVDDKRNGFPKGDDDEEGYSFLRLTRSFC